MSITADCHMHSHHSGDSEASMADMVEAGLKAGLDTMCFTEHHDIDAPDSPDGPGSIFLLNTDSYLYELLDLRQRYEGRMKILFGVELGLQTHLFRETSVFAKSCDFDFIIGSQHFCDGEDPYYPAFFEGRSDEEAYRQYFQCMLNSVKKYSNYDVLGHMDYVVRYGKTKDTEYTYERYSGIIDEILTALIDKGKGLEINTAGLSKGLKNVHPLPSILKRYRELGGEIVTIGSDAHDPAHVAQHFNRASEALAESGFKYYAVFEKRVPEFHRL